MWTLKDKVVGPTMLLVEGGPQWVRRIVFFCGFPVYRFHYVKP